MAFDSVVFEMVFVDRCIDDIVDHHRFNGMCNFVEADFLYYELHEFETAKPSST